MKRIILLSAFIGFLSSASAQTDSTAIKLEQLRTGMIYMRENFKKSHNEFSIGLAGVFLGGAVSATSLALEGDSKTRFIVIGSFLSTVGMFVMLDSHKFIGRAGSWKFTPTSIAVDF